MGLFSRPKLTNNDSGKTSENPLLRGLRKTRAVLTTDLGDLFTGRKAIDDDLLEELENRLLVADVGVEVTMHTLEALRKRIGFGDVENAASLISALRDILNEQLSAFAQPELVNSSPYTILVVGVNGSGKTTTIGKLAHYFSSKGKSVMLAAGDTFRAAAVEQLQMWGERNNIPVVAQTSGADSAAVVFDALQSAQAKSVDILLADTAGRLHTQSGLMDELRKVKRVLAKLDAGAPQETLLVLDASIGQNALQQAKEFHQAIGITGIVLTKLDGTAKGGIVFAIQQQLSIPVKYVGIGEGIDDIHPFNAANFVDALLAQAI